MTIVKKAKWLRAVAVSALSAFLVLSVALFSVLVVLAATYTATVTVTNASVTSYGMLPISYTATNAFMAANGFIAADGLDVQVENAGSDLPVMVADSRTLFASAIGSYYTGGFTFSSGNTPASAMSVIVGYGGSVAVADDPALEPTDNFEFYWSGYIDTSAGASKDIIYKQDSFRIYVNGAGSVRAAILAGGDAETLALTHALSSGATSIKITADGANFNMYLAGAVVPTETIALGGASVPGTANGWTLFRNNTAPYTTELYEKVGAVQVLLFEPVAIIVGTALPDLAGAAHNGVITWGTNPADISVSVGPLTAMGDADGDADVPSPDYAPETDNSSDKYYSSSTVPASLQLNPIRPLVELVEDVTSIPEMVVWITGATFIICLGVALSLIFFSSHVLFSGIVGLVLTGLFIGMEIYPWWTVLGAVSYLAVTIIMERQPSL